MTDLLTDFIFGAVIAWFPLIVIGMVFWPGAHGWDVGIPAIIVGLSGGIWGALRRVSA